MTENKGKIEKMKMLIDKYLKSSGEYRCAPIILKGRHKSGKTALLLEIKEHYQAKIQYIDFNLSFLNQTNEFQFEINQKAMDIFNSIWEKTEQYEIIVLDHIEQLLKSVKTHSLLNSIIHQSRAKFINGHPLIIIVALPIDDSTSDRVYFNDKIRRKIQECYDVISMEEWI